MAKRKPKAASGRPTGSKNKKYKEVVDVPVSCPACPSTDFIVVPGSREIRREIAGTLPDGFAFVAVTWRRSTCKDCGQHVSIRSYEKK